MKESVYTQFIRLVMESQNFNYDGSFNGFLTTGIQKFSEGKMK